MLDFFHSMRSDESLMLAYQRGDLIAFEKLYKRHKDSLFAFLYRSHVDLNAIEEIAQESWIAVINSAKNYRPTAKFRTWLYAIAHRKLVDYWRRNKFDHLMDRVNDKGEQLVEIVADSKQSETDAVDLSTDLLLALESLSREQQQAYLLKHEGFSRREISVMTGCNEETIKSRIRYASNHLRRLLEVQYAE